MCMCTELLLTMVQVLYLLEVFIPDHYGPPSTDDTFETDDNYSSWFEMKYTIHTALTTTKQRPLRERRTSIAVSSHVGTGQSVPQNVNLRPCHQVPRVQQINRFWIMANIHKTGSPGSGYWNRRQLPSKHKLFDTHCCHMGTTIKHHVPDWVKPNFWHLGTLTLCLIVPWMSMFYSCTHLATVGDKVLMTATTKTIESV